METQANLAALLQFYADAGADEAIGDAPVNRVQSRRPHVPEKNAARAAVLPIMRAEKTESAPAAQAAESAPVAGAIEAMKEAETLAAGAETIEALKAAAQNFNGLALKRTATQIVFADGNAKAGIMLVGDAPGTDEDRAGIPFAGASGQLLDKMLGAIGLSRAENVYIATILNWRTPGNRAPTQEEIAISLPFIRRHIALVNPGLIVPVGGAAAKILLGKKEPVSRLRGKWFDYNGTPATVLFHPEYLLQSPQQKKPAWEDLQMIRAKLKELGLL